MNILLISLVMVAISGLVGFFIKSKIWGSTNKPANAIEYGRAWGAYLAFIAPLASIHLFIQRSFIDALVGLAINLIVFPLLAFLCGYVYGQFKSINSQSSIRITAYVLFAISLIGFIFAFQSLNDNHMFAYSAMAKVNFDVGIVLANYFGALVVPVCILLLGLKLHKKSKTNADFMSASVAQSQAVNADSVSTMTINNPLYSKAFELIKQNKQFSIISFVIVCLIIVVVYARNDNKADWFELAVFPATVWDKEQGGYKVAGQSMFYVDSNSITKSNNYTYAYFGTATEGVKARYGFIKHKGEFDCGNKKYRITEQYLYGNNLKEGLTKPVDVELDYQKNIYIPRAKYDNPTFIYNGGWESVAGLQETISQFTSYANARSSYEDVIGRARAEISLINYVCSK